MRASAVRRSSLGAAVVAAAAGLVVGVPVAAGAVTPVAQCVVPASTPGQYVARFGAANDEANSIVIPTNTLLNSFTPVRNPPGSPSTFAPGFFPSLVDVALPTGFNESWRLDGTTATAFLSPQAVTVRNAEGTGTTTFSLPATPTCGPTQRGTYDPARTYYVGDIVQSDGGSRIARTTAPAGATPTAGTIWAAFAQRGPTGETGLQGTTGPTGAAGPQGVAGPAGTPGALGAMGETGAVGLRGDAGPAGPAGRQGEPGPAGPSGAVASKRTIRFDRRGRAVVRDPSITRSSVVMLQYIGALPARARPTSVVSVAAGTLRATGQPNARFRYLATAP